MLGLSYRSLGFFQVLWEVIGEFYVRELHGHVYVLKILCWMLFKNEWSKTRIEAGSTTVGDQGRDDGSLKFVVTEK